MNPESISPELAALIVKRYVLPMFESNEKKSLKNKYNKISSISDNIGLKMSNMLPKAQDFSMPGVKSGPGSAPMGTVYGELKLSEKLSNELNQVKSIVDHLNENLEEANYYKNTYKNELDQLKDSHKKKEGEIRTLKTHIIELRE